MSDTSEMPKGKSFESVRASAMERLTRFDMIRIQKLLEMGQYAIIYLIISMVICRLLNKLLPSDTEETVKRRSTPELLILVFIETILFTWTIYYVGKITRVIPFLFHLTPEYESDKHAEIVHSSGVVSAVFCMRFMTNFNVHINELLSRYGSMMDGLNLPFI